MATPSRTLAASVRLALRRRIAPAARALRRGFLGRYRSRRLVVIVGNLTAGGTGKTPFVIWLAGELADRGLTVGVATRGYKGAKGSARRLTDVDSASDAGDEAMMIRRRLAVPVAVAPRRADAVRLLEADCNVILCDDGLQHYALARDVELVVVDGMRGFGNGLRIPAGRCANRSRGSKRRMPSSSMERARIFRVRFACASNRSPSSRFGRLAPGAVGICRPRGRRRRGHRQSRALLCDAARARPPDRDADAAGPARSRRRSRAPAGASRSC
jgi:hypothetical protein